MDDKHTDFRDYCKYAEIAKSYSEEPASRSEHITIREAYDLDVRRTGLKSITAAKPQPLITPISGCLLRIRYVCEYQALPASYSMLLIPPSELHSASRMPRHAPFLSPTQTLLLTPVIQLSVPLANLPLTALNNRLSPCVRRSLYRLHSRVPFLLKMSQELSHHLHSLLSAPRRIAK